MSFWRALENRNFALYFAGQGVSMVGSWLQQTAMTWLVFRLTNSAWLLGVVGFAGQLPSFLLAPVAGVWTDRWDRHRTLIATQLLAMAQAFVLAGLAYSGAVRTWHLIALSAFLGAVSSLDIAVRQAFVVDLVRDGGDLANAIALNSALTNGTRLLGPAMAGLLIPVIGESGCFLANAISFGAVVVALLVMTVEPHETPARAGGLGPAIREGFAYAWASRPIRTMIALVGLVSFAGLPFSVLLPAFVANALHGASDAYGMMMAASGLGATFSAIYLASRGSPAGIEAHIGIGAATFGASLMGLSACHHLWTGLLAMMAGGYGMMVQFAATNTVIQILVDPDKRGRVMSIYLMGFFGMTPLGSLLEGALAERIGTPLTLAIGGAVCLGGAAAFVAHRAIIARAVHESLSVNAKS